MMPTFSYLAGYRINKPIAFLYSNCKHREGDHGHTGTHNSLREKKGSVNTPNKEARNLSSEALGSGEESQVHEVVESW